MVFFFFFFSKPDELSMFLSSVKMVSHSVVSRAHMQPVHTEIAAVNAVEVFPYWLVGNNSEKW